MLFKLIPKQNIVPMIVLEVDGCETECLGKDKVPKRKVGLDRRCSNT